MFDPAREPSTMALMNAPDVGTTVATAAGQLKVHFLTLLSWLFAHPSAAMALVADVTAGDYAKAVADLVADYQAAQTP